MEKPESSPIENPEQLKREELNSLADAAVTFFNSGKFDDVLGILDKLQIVSELKEIVTLEKARDILGEKLFLGPEAIKKTFEIELKPEQIPPIPFSRQELNRARQLDQFLILRVDVDKDGKPLTAARMKEILDPRLQREGRGKVFPEASLSDDFFAKDVPRFGWALTAKEIKPLTFVKNYFQQIQILAQYLTDEVFRDQELPLTYRSSITLLRFNESAILDSLNYLYTHAHAPIEEKSVLDKIFDLEINWLLRPTFSELVYDNLVYYIHNKEKFQDRASFVASRTGSDQTRLIRLNPKTAPVLKFDFNYYINSYLSDCGAVFSRRASI